ncbi:glycogen debranching protein GlgX [Arsenicicoccus dermatophilus]|uniref:glycogen debranching protein GlgX n=1 Tax=Arsenicicoccus dermatophilus TaxID=1076331 RepID=UPI001F4CE70F|nr:glycogen debranching protein GlgX [Arsenicicoccus dermatophilus]MCH8612399.1 glycogen debranching protein GlgX [Arsenicicoccus dermatophilus]
MPATLEQPPRLGVTLLADGAAVAVHAGHATAVELCLFEAGDATGASERRIPLRQRAFGTWFDVIPGMRAGQRYGYRVHGPWSPAEGHRHNPAKLLMDPYARALEGQVTWRPEIFGHRVDADLRGENEVRDDRDDAAFVPRCVVVDDDFDWAGDERPRTPPARSFVYEAHLRGLTRTLPGVPEELRGTYAGMAHPVTVAHLRRIGVTAVELLPIHAFTHEPHLATRGLTNHWGYNTLGFFAPHAPYASTTDPQGVVDEVKRMVRDLHRAGIEVILDVVYNHTCEQSVDGATLSLRGLDSATYYRLDGRGHDVDVTGCGNTVDTRHVVPLRLVLDSLRHWVQEMHVDGFRFDLAVALGRGRDDGFDPDHPFLMALRADPLLRDVKLVAEPWDIGFNGWRTGQFPPPFSEWNDRFRDGVRNFWLVDAARSRTGVPGHGVSDLATRLAGSEDLFARHDRNAAASINFVAAHDGFTLADLTAYDSKHNEANGEDNRDGSDHNRSWNHGVEGPAGADDDGVAVEALRRRSIRNLLGTLMCSAGVPMLVAGDELGRTQQGNNNAYCQDNPLGWVDWDLAPWQEDLVETTAWLARLRRDHPVLRQTAFFGPRAARVDGSRDLMWFDAAGVEMRADEWHDPRNVTLLAYLDGGVCDDESFLLVMHSSTVDLPVTLPQVPGVTGYRLAWDSAWERPGEDPGERVLPGQVRTSPGPSMQVWRAER